MAAKIAIFIHSGLETYEGKSRVLNALHAVKEFKDAGDHIDLIFDGAGTRTAVQIAIPGNDFYALFKDVEDVITGVCRFCATQWQVTDDAQQAGFALLDDFGQHPSIRNFITNGYQVVNF